MHPKFSKTCRWCWHPDSPLNQPGFMLFRREFTTTNPAARLRIRVTADHRYNLYLDGRLLGRGPCRSDPQHYRYESYDEPLTPGPHVLAARVVIFPPHGADGNTWAVIAEMHHAGGWLVGGGIEIDGQPTATLETPEGWRCRPDPAHTHRSILAENTAGHACLAPMEQFDATRALPHWNQGPAPADGWVDVMPLWFTVMHPPQGDPGARWWLLPRDIPPLIHEPLRVARVAHVHGATTPAAATAFFTVPVDAPPPAPLTIPAGTTATITLDVGHLTTAFPRLTARGAGGGRVRLRYSESLFTDGRKQVRTSGIVAGYSDLVILAADSTAFEPFWFRTFRFLELHVDAPADAPVELQSLSLQAWRYPFEPRGTFAADDRALAQVWDVAWRTATLCAHEHYEDCPYYEQLQYVGDTRIQALISYWMAGDGRLGRQAILHFDWSRLPEGITQSRYPSNWTQVIPGFSLYWVLMIRDYHQVYGDAAFLRERLPGVRAVLDWFEQKRQPDGLVGPLPYWNFHDWVKEWPRGCPSRDTDAPVTLDSLLYAEACRAAAWLHAEAGAPAAEAAAFTARHASLVQAVNARCFDAGLGLYLDLPGAAHVSQHTNAWAIIAGAITGHAAHALGHTIATRTDLSPASLYFAFYLCRAWEQAGCYDLFWAQLNHWKDVLRWNFTTFPEVPSPDCRSDCHAWSASPLYELLACVLGVQPGAPGFRSLILRPHPGPLPRAAGRACAGDQMVDVRWEVRPNQRLHLEFTLERPLPVTIHWPNGTIQELGLQHHGVHEGGL